MSLVDNLRSMARAEHDDLSLGDDAADKIEQLQSLLIRARVILGNMAAENEGAIFRRWPIHHEPLRHDARNLLPLIDEALT